MHDYKAMTVFVKVVEHGSMQAAAEKLQMTASAISQTIQKLEQQLNIKLLTRTTRKLSLTEAGEAFYEHAAQIEKNADNALKSLEQLRSSPSGQLNIACVTGLTDSLFVNVFKSVLDRYSDFRLNLLFEDKLIDLEKQRIDIAIRAGEGVLSDNMIARHITDFEWHIVASPAFFTDKAVPTTLEELQSLDWISFSNPKFQQFTLKKGKQQKSIQPAYRIHCNTLYASRCLTTSGLGISLQPNVDVQKMLGTGELIRLFPDWQLPAIPLYLVTLQRIQSEKVRIACELIMDYFNAKLP
ncbi:transcriptional regulator [Bibersteinia trehalosi USDA-ARS-USMARC-188]|uniref:Transcriptional regulator n=2 Tax=Bibersteinia trehalosi TaxID=47735 RepID=A0A4V7I8S1_BIBTR|nr:LysR family transcriptional regulator [Bibersteinia trehalosi]AGH38805.1 transcriptional regulator [Bibersteinia trehalosi USDA-ARS-USMARC-192]AHG81396.1 transcriptional regulator [Bibersteinia trehalosi USDA-ARS-USMARC-188]AHG83662.1 transcriptional regulator [Bibersteinia trehalosi USDA-ARS-USMARC-189]